MRQTLSVPLALLITAGYIFAQATQPATQPQWQLEHWLIQLNDVDPFVRETAKQNLMQIGHDGLDRLHQAAKKLQPLTPQQSVTLHNVVVQLVLAEPTTESAGGFIGASLMACVLPPVDGHERHGILIIERLPGFCAYAKLRNGDIVVAVDGKPTSVQNTLTFQQEIEHRRPGTTVNLELIRAGKPEHVSLEIAGRPVWARDAMNLPETLQARQQEAQEYWNKMFERPR